MLVHVFTRHFVFKISRREVDHLSRQIAIGSYIDRYPPRSFLEVKSSTFTESSVELEGLKSCCFTLKPPSRQLQGIMCVYMLLLVLEGQLPPPPVPPPLGGGRITTKQVYMTLYIHA